MENKQQVVNPQWEDNFGQIKMAILAFNSELDSKLYALGIESFATPDIVEAILNNPTKGISELREKIIKEEQSKVFLPKDKTNVATKWNQAFGGLTIFAASRLTTKRFFTDVREYITFDHMSISLNEKKALKKIVALSTVDVCDHHLKMMELMNEQVALNQKFKDFFRQYATDWNAQRFPADPIPGEFYPERLQNFRTNGVPDLEKIVLSGTFHEKRRD